jgi:NAD(P)-dependent dehydrogenase (short-subunit alcohol dehydrogenase family)
LATGAAFVREGATVILASRNEKRAKAALKSLKAGKQASWTRCDVSKGKDVEKLCAAIKKAHGRLDYAFNNGGSGGSVGPVASGSETEWRKTMDGYLTSAFLCLRYEIPLMLEKGTGVIVNNASVDGLRGYPFPGGAAYSAAKHGVIGLTRSAALENAKAGLRISAICPGWVDTPAITRYLKDPALKAEILRQTPRGKIASPEEIASSVLWLCSDGAAAMTGSPLIVDGGYMA